MTDPILTDIAMDRFLAQVDALAVAIATAPWRPDHIVGVGRGGLVPATFLSHAIDRPMLSIDLSAGVPDFADLLLERLRDRAAKGARLLFVDDINDSGSTINGLKTAMADTPDDAVRFAVLIDNIRSIATIDYRAETIDRSVTKDWFVFPWEAVASRDAVVKDWGVMPDRTR
ncbi:phosphoribosyltransferase [Sphingobium sp.]|uniref:phosphoribosyltransferase n=1 Tax=Sphingobium sp. TaxID=1912891 RepID=UPI003BB4BF90